MDWGNVGMNKCYKSMESIDNNVSFMELLNMVAHDAENNKAHVDDTCQLPEHLVLGSVEDVFTENNVDYIQIRDVPNMEDGDCDGNSKGSMENVIERADEVTKSKILFGSELPDESIGTCFFEDSSINCGASFCSDDISKATGSRSYSNFNNLDEDCGAMDVTSQIWEYNGGLIEESMRKYCEDKKRVMFKPEVGMEFSSTEEAFQFCNMYSWVAGFSIRLGDNYTTKSKQRTMQEYLCQRQVKVGIISLTCS
ncbi:hypothetical protein ACQ4PT_041876 [Festuca glaucescens]